MMARMIVSAVGVITRTSSPKVTQNKISPSTGAKRARNQASAKVQGVLNSDMTTNMNHSIINASDDIWTLNVGGKIFQVKPSTLKKRAEGVLSRLSLSHESYQAARNQYFFDRNPTYFTAILDYYRTGQMHIRRDFCGSQLEEELAYWQLTDDVIGDCCWRRYCDMREEQSKNAQVRKEYMDVCQVKLSRLKGLPVWKERLWVTLDDPTYSRSAKAVLYAYLFLILVSFATACQLSMFASSNQNLNQSSFWNNNSAEDRNFFSNTGYAMNCLWYHYVELGCLSVLILFFGVRGSICPDKCRFWTNPLNIFDIMYIIFSGINTLLGLQFSATLVLGPNHTLTSAIHHLTMIIGVLRLFRAARHYRGVRELWYALRASFREVWLLSIFVTIGVLVFGIVFYCVEMFYDHHIGNVFVGFWWALITMTTVGYGDVVPEVLLGYMVAALCALVGLVMISLPIPFIAHNFNLYYGYRSRACAKLDKAICQNIYK